jgi:aminoglycoside phosphotransferase (APT) family kinase protein
MQPINLDAPTSIRIGEELPLLVLSDYLNAEIPGFGSITAVAQFPGGYSNLTYSIKTDKQEYVLRRPPFGAKTIKGGHAMEREFRLLKLLEQAGFAKIPKPIHCCEDEAVMGTPFYLMEKVNGVILRAHMAKKLSLSPQDFHDLSAVLADTLVALHAIDIETSGLIQIGKPEGYILRQVEGWINRYEAAFTDDIPNMTALSAWLRVHLPEEGKPALLHNDYKYDNLILNPERLTDVLAILDWEMSTVGDPMMDLGTALAYWAEAGDGDFEKNFSLTWMPGNLTRAEFLDRYVEKSGRDVSKVLFFFVFGIFKNAVVIQQLYSRYKKGLTKDERFAQIIFGVYMLAEKAVKAIEKGKV